MNPVNIPVTLFRAALIACAIATSTHAIAQQAAAPKVEVSRESIEKRLTSVATLVEKSSAARQIESSGDASAIEKRNEARRMHAEALAAFNGGEDSRASQLLTRASALMFEAVRLAAPEQVSGPKAQKDFETRLESVKSLLAAQKRISAEKPVQGSGETTQTIERLVAEAQRLAPGDLTRARASLDQAYLVARAAIGSMRGGDTLVRTLTFASKEEEYRYEVDRNDTHQMLIQLLLKEKSGTAGVQDFVSRARELRGRAENASRGGDWTGGIHLLEESTRELVRAIRTAGIYIPG
jgi:hypothetical protein